MMIQELVILEYLKNQKLNSWEIILQELVHTPPPTPKMVIWINVDTFIKEPDLVMKSDIELISMYYLFWPYYLPHIKVECAMHFWTYYEGTLFSYPDVVTIEILEDLIYQVPLRKLIYDAIRIFVK